MPNNLIALNSPLFWVTFFIAFVVLTPVKNLILRKWIFAGINIGFLTQLLKWKIIGILGLVLLLGLLLSAIQHRLLRVFSAAAVIIIGLYLFILHKGVSLPAGPYKLDLMAALSTVGFAFVALRIVEVLRAVLEGRQRAPDYLMLINYLLPFHMLAAGPIQAYDDFASNNHLTEASTKTAREYFVGIERIAGGLFKKFVIATIIKNMFLTNFQVGGAYLLVEMQMFLIWLYFDFSAYSDIAVGVGSILGIATPENFNKPFLAPNLIDF